MISAPIPDSINYQTKILTSKFLIPKYYIHVLRVQVISIFHMTPSVQIVYSDYLQYCRTQYFEQTCNEISQLIIRIRKICSNLIFSVKRCVVQEKTLHDSKEWLTKAQTGEKVQAEERVSLNVPLFLEQLQTWYKICNQAFTIYHQHL